MPDAAASLECTAVPRRELPPRPRDYGGDSLEAYPFNLQLIPRRSGALSFLEPARACDVIRCEAGAIMAIAPFENVGTWRNVCS
jgi:hypothetical protein